MKSNLKKTIKKELSLLTEQSQQIPMEVEVVECGTMGFPQTLHINLWGQSQGATGNPVPPNQGDAICDGALQPGGSNWIGDPNMCMGPIFEIAQVLGPSTQSALDFGLLSDPSNGMPFNGCAQITFDCSNPTGFCMYDPNVQGQYTNLQDCQQNCNWQPETYDCDAGNCVSAGFTGAGAYSDYVTCFNTGCGGPEPGASFTASICKCTMDPVLQIPCPPLGTTRTVTNDYTIDFLTPNQGDAFLSHCVSGSIGVDSWMCTWEVTSISGYGEPQIQRNRNSSTCDSDERGCLDPMALNYNQCCDLNIPNCIPVLSTSECCEYEQGDHKGCMDPAALNYMTCCDQTIPGCVPNGPSPECCKYEGEPDPCKLNPKECWFCTHSDIDTSDWQDPMAIVNANGGCIQFLSTSGPFASSYSGQMFTTKIDCENNTECKPSGGETKHCTCCKKTENGTVAGFSLSTAIPVGDSCSQFNNSQPGLYGCVDSTTWSLSKCKQPLPNDPVDFNLAEEIKRYKQLL